MEREGEVGVEVGGGGEAEGGEGGLNSHTLAARGWGMALAAEVIEFSFRIREDEKILFLKTFYEDNLIH